MYLATLNERKKHLFLGMAHYLSSVDGNFCEDEKYMLELYCKEMDISLEESKVNIPIEDVINEMKSSCSNEEKKIIVFEIVGLAMSDLNYHIKEKAFVKQLIEEFNLDEKYADDSEALVKEYFEFQRRMNDLVIG